MKLKDATIVLPHEVFSVLQKVAWREEISVEEVVSRIFLLGFVSFDRDLYVLEDDAFKKILYGEKKP